MAKKKKSQFGKVEQQKLVDQDVAQDAKLSEDAVDLQDAAAAEVEVAEQGAVPIAELKAPSIDIPQKDEEPLPVIPPPVLVAPEPIVKKVLSGPEGQQCGNCIYFLTQDLYGRAEGSCHALPPEMPMPGHSMFPTVQKEDWCGHFCERFEKEVG